MLFFLNVDKMGELHAEGLLKSRYYSSTTYGKMCCAGVYLIIMPRLKFSVCSSEFKIDILNCL